MEKTEILTLRENGNSAKLHKCFILGTAHVSKVSAEDVRQLVRNVKPEAIVLELCPARKGILTLDESFFHQDATSLFTLESIRKNGIFVILYSAILMSACKQLGVLPGEEFRVAYREGIQLKPKAKMVFGDRPVRTTISRFWRPLSLFNKLRLCYYLISESFHSISESDVENLRENDALQDALEEMGQKFPTLLDVIVKERDLYLASSIHNVLKEYTSVVAVVGSGHVQGIRKAWEIKESINRNELLQIPEESACARLWKLVVLIPTFSLGMVILSKIR